MNATTIIFFIAFLLKALTAFPTDPAIHSNRDVGIDYSKHKVIPVPSNDCNDGTDTIANISTTTSDYKFTLNVGVSPKKTQPSLKHSVPGDGFRRPGLFNRPLAESDTNIQDFNDKPRQTTEFRLPQDSSSSVMYDKPSTDKSKSVPRFPRHDVKSKPIDPSPDVTNQICINVPSVNHSSQPIESNLSLQSTDHQPISGFSQPINTQMETPMSDLESSDHVKEMPTLKLSLSPQMQDQDVQPQPISQTESPSQIQNVENQPTESSINQNAGFSKVADLPTVNFSKSQSVSDSSQSDETSSTTTKETILAQTVDNKTLPDSTSTTEASSENIDEDDENDESSLENPLKDDPPKSDASSENVITFEPYQDESLSDESETKDKSPSNESKTGDPSTDENSTVIPPLSDKSIPNETLPIAPASEESIVNQNSASPTSDINSFNNKTSD